MVKYVNENCLHWPMMISVFFALPHLSKIKLHTIFYCILYILWRYSSVFNDNPHLSNNLCFHYMAAMKIWKGKVKKKVREKVIVLIWVDRSLFCKHYKLKSTHTRTKENYALPVEETVQLAREMKTNCQMDFFF